MENGGVEQRHLPNHSPTTLPPSECYPSSPSSASPSITAPVSKRIDDVSDDVRDADAPLDFSVKRQTPANRRSDVIKSDVMTSSTPSSPGRRSPTSNGINSTVESHPGLQIVPNTNIALDPSAYSRLSLNGLSMTSSPDGGVSTTTTSSTAMSQQQAGALAAAQLQMLMMADNKHRQLLQLQALAARMQAAATTSSSNNNNNNHQPINAHLSLADITDHYRWNVTTSRSTAGGGTPPSLSGYDVHATGRKRGRACSTESQGDMVDGDDAKSVITDSGGGRDSSYLERRRKNNEAAKRSRDARRAKEEEVALKACILEEENKQLRVELASLKQEINRLKQLLFMCQLPLAAANPTSGTS